MIMLTEQNKDRWVMSPDAARKLSIELNYLANEAEDHEITQMSQIICDESCCGEFRIFVKSEFEEKPDDI